MPQPIRIGPARSGELQASLYDFANSNGGGGMAPREGVGTEAETASFNTLDPNFFNGMSTQQIQQYLTEKFGHVQNLSYDPSTGNISRLNTDGNTFADGFQLMSPMLAAAGVAAAGAMAAGGAAAGAGALEGAAAFGGEALGAAANSAGYFGGSVAPWAAGAGIGTSTGGGMDWTDFLDEVVDVTGGDVGSTFDTWSPESGADWQTVTNDYFDPTWADEWSPASGADYSQSGVQNLIDQVKNLPSGAQTAAKTALQKLLGGDTSALSALKNLGIPAALIAGLFEGSNNPLTGPMTQGAIGALDAAGRFAALPAVPQTASQRRAIALANSNVGDWKPYMDRAGVLTDEAAEGLTPERINALMNPYLRGVLDPQIRDIEEAAMRRQEQLKATVSMSGNDFRTPGTNRFNVEDSLLDGQTLRAVGDATGKAYSDAYGYATTNAGKDLDRALSAGNAYRDSASRVGSLGSGDVTSLRTAGALEQEPYRDRLAHESDTAKLYSGVVHGNAGIMDSVGKPSILSQATGAIGALDSARKLGIWDNP